jgi:hypothetical protein
MSNMAAQCTNSDNKETGRTAGSKEKRHLNALLWVKMGEYHSASLVQIYGSVAT